METYTYEVIKENERLPVRFERVCSEQYTIPAHWHEHLEILYLLSGKMSAVIQAKSYKMTVGDVLVINSRDIHMTQTMGKKTEYLLLQISDAQLRIFFPDFHLLRFQTQISQGSSNVYDPAQYLREMFAVQEKQEDGCQLQFMAKLYELLYGLYRGYARWQEAGFFSARQRKFDQISRVIIWIQAHYQEPLRLEEAAKHLGFSKEYFCRIFKQYTGQTFLEYLNGVRAVKLYEELTVSGENLTLLMEKHGITNYKVFLRTFRKLYGETPQKIRSRRREERVFDI